MRAVKGAGERTGLRKAWLWWEQNQRKWAPYVLIMPFFLTFAVFMLYPVISSLRLSFYEAGGFGATEFVGFQNYVRLFEDARFLTALRNTTVFTLAVLLVQVPFALLIAMTVRSFLVPSGRLKSFYRLTFFMPYITSLVVVALIFGLIFARDYGLLNSFLASVGLPKFAWLKSESLALPAVTMTAIWAHFGINSLYFLAGLQNIPEELHEAAAVDGAGRWRTFWHVTLPLLRPVTLFVVVQATIFSYQLFEIPYLLTGGGPSDSTLTLAIYLYEVGFNQFERGYASAIGYVMVLIAVSIAAVQLLLYRRFNR